jgi:hypothetical protein
LPMSSIVQNKTFLLHLALGASNADTHSREHAHFLRLLLFSLGETSSLCG